MTNPNRFVEVDGVQYSRTRAVALGLLPAQDKALQPDDDGTTSPPAGAALEHGDEAIVASPDGSTSLVTSDALKVPPVGRGRGRSTSTPNQDG